jgi:hypothetical protein
MIAVVTDRDAPLPSRAGPDQSVGYARVEGPREKLALR